MKNINYKIILILIIATTGCLFQLNAQMTIDSIIKNHLNVTGLMKSPNGFKNYSIEGEIMQNKMGFPIKIKGIVPDKFRMDMTFNQLNFIKISNGKTKWEYNPMNDSLITELGSSNEAQDFAERWCGALILFANKEISGKLMGTGTIDDIEVYKLEIRHGDQIQVYYIDKYSFLIIRIDDDYVENKITYYNDYRKVGNYYLPFGLTGYEDGIPVMGMKFRDIKINTQISESEFAKPQ